MKKQDLKKKRTETLRKIAAGLEIEGADTLERPELIDKVFEAQKAVRKEKTSDSETPVETPEVPAEGGEKETPAEETPETPVAKKEKKAKKEKASAPQEQVIFEEKVPAPGSKAEKMKQALAAQPKVMIIIPLEPKEDRNSTYPLIMNGYRMNILKGRYVPLPKQCAELIMRSQQMTQEAISNYFLMDEEGVSPAMREKMVPGMGSPLEER